jgi:CheY-like chemotaxis protein
VDLAHIAASAQQLVEPTLPAGVRLVNEVPADLPPVLGAAGDLEQVVVNLLVNARDAVGPVGTIRLGAKPFRLHDQGGGVALVVEDDGPGIPDARKEEVFQPFFSTKQRGTGLGLAVARQILRDHHGRIWVEDRKGGGARFVVALRPADLVDEAPAPLPAGRRLVLVEDEQVLLEDYHRALVEAGYEVHAFSSPLDAARHLESAEVDLLVTDVAMPDMDGVALARLCLHLHHDTPILFVSAFVPHESLRDLPEGSWQWLHKPVRAARLVATVGRVGRRAERRARGDEEITSVSFLFPDLTALSGGDLGLDDPRTSSSRIAP